LASADCSVTIKRPVEDVFAVLTDPTLSPRWSSNAIKGEILTEGPPGVGTRRRAVVKGLFGRTMESVMEVTELEPNRMVALKLISATWGGSGRTKYTFSPVDGGTRVDWHWEMEPGGLIGVFSGPFMALFQRAFQRDLNNLKTMMESGAL
jgi:uncharacterized protein YndB with AHSA1/START domain